MTQAQVLHRLILCLIRLRHRKSHASHTSSAIFVVYLSIPPLSPYHPVSILRPFNIGYSAFLFLPVLEPVSCQRANSRPSQLFAVLAVSDPLLLPSSHALSPLVLLISPSSLQTPDFLPHASVELSRQLQPHSCLRRFALPITHTSDRSVGSFLLQAFHHPCRVCAPT
ncbi:hypothetical protein CORC01_09324 [Colletotrichum orchidophilum]|uniref:Uncharacterized protein n=1 Tax=Colletotrichum orchidophilum TaxID=1209926 RepID=A0A1G4B1T6_9PEZI|nr:uncharacterized protein CORC01_09324 [Colletotrichum orchidophilum]OHE95313.1 hypothetical protein CORC01_09324 [Colletotrichum orchidophilum]